MGSRFYGDVLAHLAGGECGRPVQPLGTGCQPRSGDRGVVQLAQSVLGLRRVRGKLPSWIAHCRRYGLGGGPQSLRQDAQGM